MRTPSMSKTTASVIRHKLDEVPVGIAEVDGSAVDPTRAATLDGTDLDGHSVRGQPLHGVLDGALPHEAEILRPGSGHRRFGRHGPTHLVHVDHGAPRYQRGKATLALPPLVDAEGLAAQDLPVEGERRLEVLDDEDDMIQRGNHVRR